MNNDKFVVLSDGIYKPLLQCGEDVYEMVISKEAFIEAYKKWIKSKESDGE